MNLKFLTPDELMGRLGKLVQTERKITHLILECLNEIELRHLHLEMGYSSLYYLLTEKYGYTPASAQRRIDGARLLRQVPILADKIENGDLNLTKVSLIQKSIKQAEKESNTKYTREQKQILVEKVSQAQGTIEQTQVLLAQELNLSIPTPYEKTQHHKDASATLTMHLTTQEMEQIQQVRDLLSNSTKSLELKDLFIYLARRELKKYDKKKNDSQNTSLKETGETSLSQKMNSKIDNVNNIDASANMTNNPSLQNVSTKKVSDASLALNQHSLSVSNQLSDFDSQPQSSSKENPNLTSPTEARKDLSTKEATNKSSSNISTKTKRSLINPQASCAYVDPKTKHQYKAKVFLSMDHFTPQFAGGRHEPENLQVLCKNHNIYRYKKQAGIERRAWK